MKIQFFFFGGGGGGGSGGGGGGGGVKMDVNEELKIQKKKKNITEPHGLGWGGRVGGGG